MKRKQHRSNILPIQVRAIADTAKVFLLLEFWNQDTFFIDVTPYLTESSLHQVGDGDIAMVVEPKEPITRDDGLHAPKQSRGDPGLNLPPMCRANLGFPVNLSPFIQVRLPKGFQYNSKESRAMSYRDAEGAAVVRGTMRTYAMAKASCESWAWQWWDSLSAPAKTSLKTAQNEQSQPAESSERPSKRAKKN